jgi:dTDP-4-dehydrorhamnose reductase
MVGRAVSEYCKLAGDEVLLCDHASLDISDARAVMRTLESGRPDTVINCAAWTDVDACESDEARAQAVNARGPENLARACRAVSAAFVTISTDYVFKGDKDGFYTQRDDPNPQSVYAASKLDGERRAQTAYARTIVVRSGFIFGPGGRNFLSRVLGWTRRGEEFKAIADAWGTPTYAPHLAARLRELAVLDLPGTYHVVNAGEGASYEEFARAVVHEAQGDERIIETIRAESLKRAAPRPQNSRLRCLLSEAIGFPPLPAWREAVRDFVAVSAMAKPENQFLLF